MKPITILQVALFLWVLSVPLSGIAQESVVTADLQEVMLYASVDELIPVLIFFQGKRVFTQQEVANFDLLPKNTRQTLIVREIKLFADQQQADVMTTLINAKQTGKADEIFRLWGAYGISCLIGVDIIEIIAQRPEIRIIKWDKEIPPERLLDAPLNTAVREG